MLHRHCIEIFAQKVRLDLAVQNFLLCVFFVLHQWKKILIISFHLNWIGVQSQENEAPKPTQILSTLFPQTSPGVDDAEKAEQKRKEEEEKKEQDKSWKRMKIG